MHATEGFERDVRVSLLAIEDEKDYDHDYDYDHETSEDSIILNRFDAKSTGKKLPTLPTLPSSTSSSRICSINNYLSARRLAFLSIMIVLSYLVISRHKGTITTYHQDLWNNYRGSSGPTKCVIVMQGGFENSGLGDYIGSFARVLLAAKTLGCVYVPQHVWSEHGYVASNTLHRHPLDIRIDEIRTCDLSDVLDLDYLHDLDDVGCDVPIKSNVMKDGGKPCNVISYNPGHRILTGNKIHCIQDEWIRDWESIRGHNQSTTHQLCGPENSAAIHHRYGDVRLERDRRALNREELQNLYDVVTKVAGIEPRCITVVAEGYPYEKIDWIQGDHVVANTTDLFFAIDIMTNARVLAVSPSSFMPIVLPIAKADTLIMLEHRRCDFGLVARSDTRQLIIRERRGRLKKHFVDEGEYKEVRFRDGCSRYID